MAKPVAPMPTAHQMGTPSRPMVVVLVAWASIVPIARRSASTNAATLQTRLQKASIAWRNRAGSQPVKLSTMMLLRMSVP